MMSPSTSTKQGLGYAQQPGIDFNETYAPVVRMETVITVLALTAQHQLPVFQLDAKSDFLNEELKEEVYVKQPQGYIIKGQDDKVYRLREALYRLKEALRAWSRNILTIISFGMISSRFQVNLHSISRRKVMTCLFYAYT